MLLIWDIHITSKVKSELIKQIRDFIASQPEEKNLIFLGDFVYHFSYDRASLLALFEFFLECYAQGKNVYVLAGNHDRLGTTFVFEEGRQVFDLLKQQQTVGKLYFITKPRLTELEGEKILFLPFCLDLHEYEYSAFESWKTPLTEELSASKNKNEHFSGKLNQLVNAYLQQEKNLTIIHHYYINKEKFPTSRSTFSYKDIALSEQLLDNPNIKLISGHLHAAFSYKNYLCTGSVWSTSPLEVNQMKGCFKYVQGQISFFWNQIISYLESEPLGQMQNQQLELLWQQIQQETRDNLTSFVFPLKDFVVPTLDLKKTILTLKVKKLDYEQIDEILDPGLRTQLSDFRLKKPSAKVGDLLSQLEKPDENQLQTFWWWKELLKSFLQRQYPENYDQYERALKELKIL